MAVNWKKLIVFFGAVYGLIFVFSFIVKLDKPVGTTEDFGLIMSFYMMPMTLSSFALMAMLQKNVLKFTAYPSAIIIAISFLFIFTGLFVSEEIFESFFVRIMIYAHPVLVLTGFHIFDDICLSIKEEEEAKAKKEIALRCRINEHEGSIETTSRGSVA